MGMTGACTLVKRKVFEAGVDYTPIPNIRKALRGEATVEMFTEQINYDDKRIFILESNYPIVLEGRIIGSVSLGKYMGEAVAGHPHEEHREDRLVRVEEIFGESAAMLKLREQIRLVSQVKSPVLIYGETGTGSARSASNLRVITLVEALTSVFVSVELSHATGPSPITTR